MNVNEWNDTDDILPALGRRVLLAYSGYQDDGHGGQKEVYSYSVGELHRDGWQSDEGRLEETGQFAAIAVPQWWMPIVTPPPF